MWRRELEILGRVIDVYIGPCDGRPDGRLSYKGVSGATREVG